MDDGVRWAVDSGDGRALPELFALAQQNCKPRLALVGESKQSCARYPQPVGTRDALLANRPAQDSFDE